MAKDGPKQPSKQPSKELAELTRELAERIHYPGTALDEPWFLVHLLVRYTLNQFHRLTGRRVKLIYMPASIEAAIQIDLGRTYGKHESGGKLRDRSVEDLGFGCPVVWDAEEFRLE